MILLAPYFVSSYDFSNFPSQNPISFYDEMTSTFLIANSLFEYMNAFNTAVIYAHNYYLKSLCTSCTFRNIISNTGTCAIKLNVSSAILHSLCFSNLSANYISGTENGGTCLSIQSPHAVATGFSTYKAVKYCHAAVYFQQFSIGSFSHMNISHGETSNGGTSTNGVRVRYNTEMKISYISYAHLRGGHAFCLIDDAISENQYFIFNNVTTDKENAILLSTSSTFSCDDCACYSCSPLIADVKGILKRWYFSETEAIIQNGKFEETVINPINLYLPANHKCNLEISNKKYQRVKKIIGLFFAENIFW